MDIQKRVWYTKLMMTINQAPLLKRLIITAIATKNVEDISDIESRLMHLGFVHGATIEVKKKAPLFKEPLLVEVRGRLIALSKAEAELVNVEVQA
jgi:Fe2+ transport system protein FeoA